MNEYFDKVMKVFLLVIKYPLFHSNISIKSLCYSITAWYSDVAGA